MLNTDEQTAVEAFASAHLERKDTIDEHRTTLRPLTANIRDIRAKLADVLRESGASALTLDGGKCVRGQTIQSKRTLTQRMVEDAVDDIDCVEELRGLDRSGIVSVVAKRLQQQRLVDGTTISIGTTVPAASTVVKQADEDTAKLVEQLSEIESQKRALVIAAREKKLQVQENVERVEPEIFSLLDRCNKDSHKVRVNVDDEPVTFFIRRKKRKKNPAKKNTAGVLTVADLEGITERSIPVHCSNDDVFSRERRTIKSELIAALLGGNGDNDDVESENEDEEKLTFDRSTRSV